MRQRSNLLNITRLTRCFDSACALIGVAVLVALGPTIFVEFASASGPAATELVRVDGAVASCTATRDGAVLALAGQPGIYLASGGPPETCTEAFAMHAGGTRVTTYVAATDRQQRDRVTPIPTYAMTVDGVALRTVADYQDIGWLDRIVFLGLGIAALCALFVCVRRFRRAPGALRGLLFGERHPPPDSARAK